MKRTPIFVCLAICALAGFGMATAVLASPAEQNSNVPTSQRANVNSLLGGATATPTPCVTTYTCSTTTGATIVAGTTDTGNHCDDCTTNVTLPFPISLYGASYTSVNVSSNGNAQFVSTDPEFANVCLPSSTMGPTIFAYWDDLVTLGTNCTGGCGIYTSVSGSAPNRIFNIEWRTFYFSNPGNAYFEIRLYEATPNFDVIIGTIDTVGTATIGVQDGAGRFTQCVCGTQATQNSRILFTAVTGTCPTPSPTPTGSVQTNTPTAIPTNTPVPTNTPLPPTATNTPPPIAGIIHGHLTWQGVASANRPLVTGTLTLCVGGSPISYSFNTDANGDFTVASDLPDGVYHWQVKGGRHISSASPDSGGDLVISGGQATQDFGTQKGGNTNPQTDNIVNASDFSTLKNEFGQTGNFPADFDYNQAVNVSDFGILKSNFGQAGIALTCP